MLYLKSLVRKYMISIEYMIQNKEDVIVRTHLILTLHSMQTHISVAYDLVWKYEI